jgi:flagellar basal-body rod protein FlgC
MSLFKVFDVAGTAMNAQSVRLNVTASNLANAGSVSGDPDKVGSQRPISASSLGRCRPVALRPSWE